MSENKFISRLKGEPTPKSVVEIQNDRLVAPFKSSPIGHIADRDSSVVVAKGAQNWAVNQGQLVPVADDYIGTESDLTATSRVSGAGLWLNATYTFPVTGDETNPVSAIIAPSAKWVLTLCGDSLITQNGSVITLTMLVKIGATHLTTKQFKIRECASQFSQRLAIDFSESEQKVIKAHGGSPLTVQVLCDDEGASATIYSGMTHLTLLQRKIDAELVSTDNVLLPEFIENLLEGYIIPADYFSRYDYIEQVEDGAKAMPEFTRNGDNMTFSGWAKPAEEVYTKTEIDNKFTVANAQIDANAVAIAKTRDDYMSADTDIMTIVNNHAEELTTLRGNQASLGDQVAGIEEKIPESASGTNHLITKQQLLDEEMDIRDDLNESVSELQSQITAQATAIAGKQEKLIAGDNIVIGSDGKTISATGAGGGAGLSFIVYDTLPETGESGIIYLIPKDSEAPDVYDEYVWIVTTQTFELIGSTQVDLTDYAKKEYVDNAISGFEALPDQSGNSGKFLTTNGTSASWGNATKNISNKYNSIWFSPDNDSNIGGVGTGGITIGWRAGTASGDYAIAVGSRAKATKHSIQFSCVDGGATNNDPNTFKILNENGNFEMMSADGTIPAERMSATAGTTGQVLTKTDTGMAWQEASGGTTITLKEYDE